MDTSKSASDLPALPQTGPALSFLLLFVIGVGWGGSYALNRLAVTEGVPYLAYVFWQSLGGGLLLLAILAARRIRPPMGGAHLRLYLVAGLLGLAVPYTAIVIAAPRVPVGVLTLELTLEPIMTYALALIIVMERFHRLRFAGIIVGMAGLMLIVVPETSLPSRDMVPWVLLGLTAPLSWAIWTIWVARFRPPEVHSLVLACALLLAAALLVLPGMAGTKSWWWFQTPFHAGEWAVLGAALLNAVVWVVAFECIRLTGPVFYSTWAYVGTPTGMACGIVFFGETHSAWIWSALVLLVIGLFLVNRTTPQARKVPTPRIDHPSELRRYAAWEDRADRNVSAPASARDDEREGR